MALELKKGEGAKLLSLDGGGVKGISSLLILKAIMDKVKEIEIQNKWSTSDKARLPVDYFHLTAGTSTGGIIALMLTRLRMSVEDTIKEYNKIGPKVFGTTASSGEAQFPAKPLEDAIDDVVSRYDQVTIAAIARSSRGQPLTKKPIPVPQTGLVDNQAKMFMCSTLRGRGESVLLRSYDMPKYADPVSQEGDALNKSGGIEKITIKEATRATSAAPTYFPPAKMYGGKDQSYIEFWDGGLLNNNPIDQLWRARLDLVGPEDSPPKVACVLSLGTSWSVATAPGFLDKWPLVKKGLDWLTMIPGISHLIGKIAPMEEALPYLTNTEAKHLDFRRYINRMYYRVKEPEGQTEYFRFNTPTKNVYIDMSDYKQMTNLESITNEWLATQTEWVAKVANILAKKPGSTGK